MMMEKPCLYLYGSMLTEELEEMSVGEETEIKITVKKISESLREDEKGNKTLSGSFEVSAIDGKKIMDEKDDQDEDDDDDDEKENYQNGKAITVKVKRY